MTVIREYMGDQNHHLDLFYPFFFHRHLVTHFSSVYYGRPKSSLHMFEKSDATMVILKNVKILWNYLFGPIRSSNNLRFFISNFMITCFVIEQSLISATITWKLCWIGLLYRTPFMCGVTISVFEGFRSQISILVQYRLEKCNVNRSLPST